MIHSQFSIDYLARGSDDKQTDTSGSEGDIIRTPSPSNASVHSESDSSENTESIAQVLLSLDRTIKNGFSSSDSSEKPPHSYIAMISMSILSKPDKKILLNDIYQYIMDNFPYYNNKEKAWRNSIRHNLSLNECFVKNGRSENGKGNFWSIHPACVDDFAKGDFRRRQARRRARKSIVKTGSSTSESGSRYNMGYVPMTSSQIGFHPYSRNNQPVTVSQPMSYPVFHNSRPTFGPPGKSYPSPMIPMSPMPNEAMVNAAASIGMLSSPLCATSFANNPSPPFYPSCQLQKTFPTW